MTTITDHLFYIEDTCSVFGIRSGDRALLIDCGTRFFPSSLKGTGIQRVDRILLTHFHRDQCSTAAMWKENGSEIIIPFSEKKFFEEGDLLKASYDTSNNYTSFYSASGILEEIQADGYAYDFESIFWENLQFEIIPLPGHTFGSAGYLFEVDGMRILACGDLMSGPGKIHEYYSSQWRYMDFQGHVNQMESLKRVETLKVDLIFPGHGSPFEATRKSITDLREKLEELYFLFHGKPYDYFRPEFRRLTRHVVEVVNSSAKTYVVHDDEGHALLIDCGYVGNANITANPHRYIDFLTPHLEADLGVKTVEAFLPSHYHDDHLAGLSMLIERYGTQVISSPELKDIIEHPERYDMPCLLPQGVMVKRVVERGEAFNWRGIQFFMEQHPGQTLYHHLIWFEVDGRKFLSIGDNISGLCFQEDRDYIHSFIPKNRTPVSSYGDMPRQILDHFPDTILTGHGGAVSFDKEKVGRWKDWMERWEELFTEILDQPNPDMGMDPNWIEFYPYKVRVRPGDSVVFQVKVINYEAELRECTLQFRSVEGTKFYPRDFQFQVDARSGKTLNVRVEFPAEFKRHALPVLADVTWNGRHLGEIAEAIAYW